MQRSAEARVTVRLTKRYLRPTAFGPAGGPVSLAYVVRLQGATLSTVHAQVALARGGNGPAARLARGRNGLFAGRVTVPRNVAPVVNRGSVYLILTTTRGQRIIRRVGAVSLRALDQSMPPPPPSR